MKEIGGFFGLDMPRKSHLHGAALHFNTARNALRALLTHLLTQDEGQPSRLWLPVLNCPDVEEMLRHHFPTLDLAFYNVDDTLAPMLDVSGQDGEMLYLVDLFGLNGTVTQNAPAGAIVDNVHSLFRTPKAGVHTIYSARKFFGVPDGAFLYTDTAVNQPASGDGWPVATHIFKRTDRGAQTAYCDYTAAEQVLAHAPLAGMSNLARRLLDTADTQAAITARQENFRYINTAIGTSNGLSVVIEKSLSDPEFVPFTYPFLDDDGAAIRRSLIEKRIYIPTLWNDICTDARATEFEKGVAGKTVHIPIDQRYGIEDMQTILDAILSA